MAGFSGTAELAGFVSFCFSAVATWSFEGHPVLERGHTIKIHETSLWFQSDLSWFLLQEAGTGSVERGICPLSRGSARSPSGYLRTSFYV